MDNKKVVAGVAGIAVVGILSYLGYRVVKELNELEIDFFGENIEDSYYQKYSKKNNDT
jgi:hypothetical protein